ncbi:Serpentine Receptor, class T [Caenorhabditis elegans]|uniref:Serpentine Receptor, class T n=1 Tax=Caenorhabditis elegans TaxID=6239 RepID=O16504_CAEEL|nr:Serpentine Receptor, class T [Caenorhabditis elegans]CCD83357.1 Serpentine Receptor, class T [Caenorhabditis elegans]|eukprot:NP_504386.2 Serpentine Receptor, class T [Caenorhabditis elegans]
MPTHNTSSVFNSDPELLAIGVLYVILTVVVFPAYALLIHALHSRGDLKENISYKLLNLLNYCDVSQSFCHFLTGIFLIFPVVAEKAQFFVRIIGCTANTLWLATFVIMAILASTRIGIAFFKIKATKWSVWMIISLVIGSIYIFTVWIVGCITQNFELTGPNWAYDMKVKYADLFASLELVLCFPTLALSFISYILIIYSIYKKRRISRSSSSSFRTEVGILVQATILTTYMALLITFWHNAESWFKMTNYTLASLNCVWILFSHLNFILLVSTNKGVRNQILRPFCSKNRSRQTSKLVPLSHVSSTMPVEK